MNEGDFFQDLAVLMTAAGIVSVIFSRFGWPKVLGYLAAGFFIGQYTWGGSFLIDPNSVYLSGQLGIVFLMFSMGLSFSPREMSRIRRVALPAALIDTVVMIWLGYTLGTKVLGWTAAPSLFLGVAICDSATTLLAKVIDELGWSQRPFTRYVLGTSICEDIICVGAIAVATGFARGGGMSAGTFLASLGWLGVFFLSVLVFGFIFVPRLLASVGKRKDDEALILAVLGTCFFISYFAYRFDYSLALGAFLVGVLCGTSLQHERIARMVEPLKAMFASVFFVSIGMLVDPAAVWHHLPVILLVSTVVIVGKFLNNTLASLICGLDLKTSLQVGFGLAQIGEFAFMVAIIYAGIVDDAENPMFQIAIGVSLLTTLLNPLLIRISEPVSSWAVKRLPDRLACGLATYHGWLEKILASKGSPVFRRFKITALQLGVYAVLIIAVASVCSLLPKFDFSPFSTFVERHDEVICFILANVFATSMLPLIIAAARTLASEVSEMLYGEMPSSSWQQALSRLMSFVVLMAVLALFFVEWSAINVSIAPERDYLRWVTLAVIVVVGVCGWRFFCKAGRRATIRFEEALTAEERREAIAKTMTITLPASEMYRFTLDAHSPAIGGTVVTLNIRAKTGTSIVAVERAGRLTRNIGPEWEFAVGDTLVAMGGQSQIAALKDLLGIVQ